MSRHARSTCKGISRYSLLGPGACGNYRWQLGPRAWPDSPAADNTLHTFAIYSPNQDRGQVPVFSSRLPIVCMLSRSGPMFGSNEQSSRTKDELLYRRKQDGWLSISEKDKGNVSWRIRNTNYGDKDLIASTIGKYLFSSSRFSPSHVFMSLGSASRGQIQLTSGGRPIR